MKQLLKLGFVLLAAVVLFNACGGSGDPKPVAEKFLKHLNAQEYDKAKEYATESTATLLDMMAGMSDMADEDATAEETEIVMGECTVDGDNATCNYTADGAEESIDLVKQDGEWKVDMKKEE